MQWMGFSEAALARWRREGLPAEADPYAYFGLTQVRSVPVTVFPYPRRADIELERAGTRWIVLDNRDLRVLHDEAAPYFPKYIGHPVQSQADWERPAPRFDDDGPRTSGPLSGAAHATGRASTLPGRRS